ncbi:hypothetical protein GO013_12580 [Pseudodesulfovibrio sp. JC047]|uniref:hypothetical protein n=1 Tax=Pseudodesulfovibrio sp. JC047 TaxID=2683199 RepID=UPI0013D4A8FD|nr:hypothetical protein [Pseudodesulfovibrio sp. JC047]NDV20247.1 hypothetical protein [Pseudodesulfovibrio sp. JC047]
MIRFNKPRLLFALGIGCIALGYSLWIFFSIPTADKIPFTLVPTVAAPIGSFTVAALCWFFLIEKMHYCNNLTRVILGLIFGWSVFPSGLLAAFIADTIIEGGGLRKVEGLILQAKIAVGLGPLILIMA